jgi:hypothetical protein
MTHINTTGFFAILGIVTALAATVLAFIFILPEKKRAKLPKILKIVSDILNMKQLFLETIFRALYIFSTLVCIFVGVFMIFGFEVYSGYGYSHSQWYGGWGLLIAIVGPIVVRIVYEGIMMGILLVKNTIEINKRLKSQNGDIEDAKIGE